MGFRVVLAEDDPDVQMIACAALERDHFTVIVANTGIEALARVSESRPDLILLDWMMPELDGLETCSRLKADPATRDIPVVFLTARTQAKEIERGLALGAVGYITKPFDALTLGHQLLLLLKGKHDDD